MDGDGDVIEDVVKDGKDGGRGSVELGAHNL